jgi:hypothetical protein
MADFTKFLKVKVEDIEAAPCPPAGHYFANIKSWKTDEKSYDKSSSTKTPVVTLFFVLVSPDDDVEESELPEGGCASFGPVTRDYTLSEANSLNSLRKVGEMACEIDAKGLDLEDLLNAMRGQQVKLFMEQRAGTGDNADVFYPKVSKVLSATG